MTTPWGEVGYLTYKRTYSRDGEEWSDTVDRVLGAAQRQLGVGFTDAELARARDHMLSLRGTVAGRFLWQLGTRTVKQLGLASLQNCAFTVVDDPVRPFTWAFDMLMLGSGVGYNLQQEYVYALPKVKRAKVVRKDTKDADFIVPDSREGWVRLLELTLRAFFEGKSFTYSTVCVRSKGAPIKGFGGTASGPEDLCVGIEQISNVLAARVGKKVRPIDVLDIMNIIGSVVVAGNVRRSAQIAIGDMHDPAFLGAKNWAAGNVPNWRAMSNNSVVCNDINLLPEEFWDGYLGNGEPYGLINLKLSREVGRLADGSRYPDPDVCGFNPCAEQPLAPYETCCLAEIFLPNIRSQEELFDVASILYRINKHSLNLRCHHHETQSVVHRHQRMGIGVTGYLQATADQRGWLSECYRQLRAFDVEYSARNGWAESIKITTVKPSGTLSLLAGTTSGVHPAYAQYFIRRIRMDASSGLVQQCRDHGYHVEPVKRFDGTLDHSTMVVEFPCSYPEGTVLAKDLTAVQQLEYVKELQTQWSDNAVSCTVYYRKEELPEIREWLKRNYNDSVKSVSFLLHSDHGFEQAPYEEITKARYEELKAEVTPITDAEVAEDDFEVEECEGGACPIK